MNKVNANTVIAVAALFTSVLAVLVSWDEARLIRRSQEASFRPIIAIEAAIRTGAEDLAIELTVSNSGNGVAYLEGLSLRSGDEPIENWDAFAGAVLTEELAASTDMSWAAAQGFFQPGARKPVISLAWPESERDAFTAFVNGEGQERFERFDAEACFCSVFERCWTVSMHSNDRPRPVRACAVTTDPIEALWSGYLGNRDGRGG